MTGLLFFNYSITTDNLYIQLSDKKSSVGHDDFQDNVILYRDESKKIVGIEILNFNNLKESLIKLGKNERIDFSEPFQKIRMLISLRDIMFADPEQFEDTLKQWGIQIIKEKEEPPQNIYYQTPYPEASQYS